MNKLLRQEIINGASAGGGGGVAPVWNLTGDELDGETVGAFGGLTLDVTFDSGTGTFELASGGLPSGISLVGDELTGSFDAEGAFSFTLRAIDDSTGAHAELAFGGTIAAAPDVPLLDALSGVASAAYSLRLLSADYTGDCIKVRRSSDDAELDIPIVDGWMDEDALLAHCGAGDGFITVFYDQSGNGLDHTQSNAAKQPQIVDSGVVCDGFLCDPSAVSFMRDEGASYNNYFTRSAYTSCLCFKPTAITNHNKSQVAWGDGSAWAGLPVYSTNVDNGNGPPYAVAMWHEGDAAADQYCIQPFAALNEVLGSIGIYGSNQFAHYLNDNDLVTLAGTDIFAGAMSSDPAFPSRGNSGIAGSYYERIMFKTAIDDNDVNIIGNSWNAAYGMPWSDI
jgi:hypothetical protein